MAFKYYINIGLVIVTKVLYECKMLTEDLDVGYMGTLCTIYNFFVNQKPNCYKKILGKVLLRTHTSISEVIISMELTPMN